MTHNSGAEQRPKVQDPQDYAKIMANKETAGYFNPEQQGDKAAIEHYPSKLDELALKVYNQSHTSEGGVIDKLKSILFESIKQNDEEISKLKLKTNNLLKNRFNPYLEDELEKLKEEIKTRYSLEQIESELFFFLPMESIATFLENLKQKKEGV